MTLPRQGASAVGDLDHQVRGPEGVHVSHRHHHKDLSCSPRVGTWASVWVCGGTFGDETPLASSAVDGPPWPLASFVRCLQ